MADYLDEAPSREDVDASRGNLVLDFGENMCGFCAAARPHIESALAERSDVRHVKVQDGRGRPLGRSFRVKLWPTLIVLKDGVEVSRVVRPESANDVAAALAALD
jgi:thioredoxin 1